MPQIACQPPSNIVVVVEGFSLLGDGWLRLHLEHVAGSGGIKALWVRTEGSGDAGTNATQAGDRRGAGLRASAVRQGCVFVLSGLPRIHRTS